MTTEHQLIPLSYPIQVDGVTVKQLTLRRPKVRDMLAVEKNAYSDAEKEITLFANLCEVPPASLHDLDMADYAKLQQHYHTFLS